MLAAALGADMVPHVESRYERSVESEFTARNDSALFESTPSFNNRWSKTSINRAHPQPLIINSSFFSSDRNTVYLDIIIYNYVYISNYI